MMGTRYKSISARTQGVRRTGDATGESGEDGHPCPAYAAVRGEGM
jgi:hypothetical protein